MCKYHIVYSGDTVDSILEKWWFNGTTQQLIDAFAVKTIFFYLVETNIAGIFTETLTTDVEVVLTDETGTMSTDSTVDRKKKKYVNDMLLEIV